jgi:ELP3 family radical SAM enzyme/protein acetyltransferase
MEEKKEKVDPLSYNYVADRTDIYKRKKNKNKEKEQIDFITASGGGCQLSRVFTNKDTDIENIVKPLNMGDGSILEKAVRDMLEEKINTEKEMKNFIRTMWKKYKIAFGNNQLLYKYRSMCSKDKIVYDARYELLLQAKKFRSQSGVMVITVFTSPYPEFIDPVTGEVKKQAFSCEFDCYYCPAEPDQPRSYLLEEPGVKRANSNKFDPIMQFYDRANTYLGMGHPVDKIELLILGGTWDSYPEAYREQFIRDIFYAANTYYDKDRKTNPRAKLSIAEEHKINETCKCRIIGVTIETRPDRITPVALQKLRKLGVTRVQLGIQSTDDRVLYRINRGCKSIDAIRAIKLLKECCFKIDVHLMPDLPQPLLAHVSNKKEVFLKEDIDTDVDMKEVDRAMFDLFLKDPNWQIDQMKLYPCETLPWTRLEQDFKNGSYVPYGHQKDRKDWTPLHEILIWFQSQIQPWIRINRVIRDIPDFYILGGNLDVNMRNELDKEMEKRGLSCKCIRCREVKKKNIDPKSGVIKVRKYEASGGTEYFISMETPDEKTLFGFLRLRLSDEAGGFFRGGQLPTFPELVNCALIRELHVYGEVVKVGDDGKKVSQHSGFGKKMIAEAFKIAQENNYKKIAVISGVGVMPYYRKFGFEQKLDEHFMIKTFDPVVLEQKSNENNNNFIMKPMPIDNNNNFIMTPIMICIVIFFICWFFYNNK